MSLIFMKTAKESIIILNDEIFSNLRWGYAAFNNANYSVGMFVWVVDDHSAVNMHEKESIIMKVILFVIGVLALMVGGYLLIRVVLLG